MIDWYFVGVHSLWIFGLAIVLAAFSWHDWQRRVLGRPLLEQLRLPSSQAPVSAGLLLVSIGLVMMKSATWWERTVWAALAVGFAWSAWTAWLASGGHGRDA
jgi:hypothetical protein